MTGSQTAQVITKHPDFLLLLKNCKPVIGFKKKKEILLEIRDTFLCDLLDVKYRKVSYKSSNGDVEVENVNQRQQSIVLVLANNKYKCFLLKRNPPCNVRNVTWPESHGRNYSNSTF